MVQKYTSDLPVPLSSLRQGSSLASVVVLLVGSTGSVGSHTLKELLDRSEVQRVYTLDRPGAVTVSSRQRNAFSSHGISMDALNDPRLVALTGSPCLEFLGLERHIFEQVPFAPHVLEQLRLMLWSLPDRCLALSRILYMFHGLSTSAPGYWPLRSTYWVYEGSLTCAHTRITQSASWWRLQPVSESVFGMSPPRFSLKPRCPTHAFAG